MPGHLEAPKQNPIPSGAEMGLREWYWPFSNHFFKSKRSKFMTLVQAATKSVTNFSFASTLA